LNSILKNNSIFLQRFRIFASYNKATGGKFMNDKTCKQKIQLLYQLDGRKLNEGVYCVVFTICHTGNTEIINKILEGDNKDTNHEN
jgi:hypothetical protein